MKTDLDQRISRDPARARRNLMQVSFLPHLTGYSSPITSGREDTTMYLDDAVIFGLVTVAMMVAFMGGWVAFIVRDHHRKNKH
ncbi:cytochrome c oxidase subunit CcoM [Halomonas ventosae]|nr:cytochrome c oxidase subunit CcoM [Halomonas ventosae]